MGVARTLNRWKVQLLGPGNRTAEEEVRAYWDPEFEGIDASVGQAAACQATRKSSRDPEQRMAFQPIGVTYIGTVGAAA